MEHKNLEVIQEVFQLENLKQGGKFKITIKIPLSYGWIDRVKVSFYTIWEKTEFQLQHKQNKEGYAIFETEVVLETQAVYYYHYSFEANGVFRYYKRKNLTGDTSLTKEECWKMSVGFKVPKWAEGAIMYHIFVDRYRKGKNTYMKEMPNRTIHKNWHEKPIIGPDEKGNWNIDFFGGNLKGIEETLDYIKSLGVSIIYLSPIVKSQSNHRYDSADYEEVDPYVGTNEQLKQLCNSAHRKGIKVILDAVFNHTGNDSKYFNQYGTYDTIGAYQSEQSPYYEFYKKIQNQNEKGFSFWWGMKNLPECDSRSSKWKKYITGEGGIIDQWMSLGIDGLRLDVADELTDDFIEEIKKAVEKNKQDGFILGEVWKNPMRMFRTYISSGRGMHSVMNYLLIDALIRYYKYSDENKLKTTINEILTEYPKGTINTLMNFTSTHDISRIVEILGSDNFQRNDEWAWNLLNSDYNWIREHKLSSYEYKNGKKIFKSYFFALTFLPGILSIFYGDEVGLQGIGNLANRAPYPWEKRDKELLNFIRKTTKARIENEFLRTAELNIVKIDSEKFVFERYNENEKILIFVSRTHHYIEIDIPKEYTHSKIIAKVNGYDDKKKLSPYGGIAIKK